MSEKSWNLNHFSSFIFSFLPVFSLYLCDIDREYKKFIVFFFQYVLSYIDCGASKNINIKSTWEKKKKKEKNLVLYPLTTFLPSVYSTILQIL